MDRLMGWAKNVYDKVVQDDYLQPLIVSESNRKLSMHLSDGRKMSYGLPQDDIIKNIQAMGHVTPQRQFRVLGPDPRFEIVTGRVKELKSDLGQVKEVMIENFPKYKYILNISISEIDELGSLNKAKQSSRQLKQKLQLLEQASKRSKRITFLNIKIKNIKSTIKILSQIPNIKKMSLFQLKSINIEALKAKQSLNQLRCLKEVEQFVETAVSKQLGLVITTLQECLVTKFSQQKYQNVLKNFIIADHKQIKYQKLLIKLVQKQIRKGDSEIGADIYRICEFYIKIMINLHGVFRWHRIHQDQNEWKQTKNQGKNIHIQATKVKQSIVQVMDECLKDLVLQKIYRCDYEQYLSILYLVYRISSICQVFSGKEFNQTIFEMKAFINKKLSKVKEKSVNQLMETLALQEMNKWNRLPVANNYSHDPINRNLFKIKRQKQSQVYLSMPIEHMKNLHEDPRSQKIVNGKNIQQNWEIKELILPEVQKYQKNKSQVKLNYQNQVVICQSSLSILKFLDTFANYVFYFPIRKCVEKAIKDMFFLVQYYIFYTFISFASPPLKNIFFDNVGDAIEVNYAQKRISVLYPNLFKFLRNFKRNNKVTLRQGIDTKEGQNILRLRVVATESIQFINAYFEHILDIVDKREEHQQRLQILKKIQTQESQIIFTESVSKLCKLQNTESLISKIKWTQDYHHIRQYLAILQNNFQEFYYKMRAVNKGEVPLLIIDKIFGLFWKSQLNTILKAFLSEFKPSKNFTLNPKTVFEKFIDDMYFGVQQFIQDKSMLVLAYEKIKGVFALILENEWDKAWVLFEKSLRNYEFIYRIEINLMLSAECCCYLGAIEFGERRRQIEKWITQNLLDNQF